MVTYIAIVRISPTLEPPYCNAIEKEKKKKKEQGKTYTLMILLKPIHHSRQLLIISRHISSMLLDDLLALA